MTATGWAWLAAAGILAVLDWIAVAQGARLAERIVKPLVLLAMVLAAVAAHPIKPGVHGWLIAALCLGLLGDVALVAERRPARVLIGPSASRISASKPSAGPGSAGTGPASAGPASAGPAGSGPAGSGPASTGPAGTVAISSVSAGRTTAGHAKTPRLSLDGSPGAGPDVLFLLGVLAFLLGHLGYARAMQVYGTDQLSVAFGLLLVLIALLSFGYRIIAGAHVLGGSRLTVAITLYMVALGTAVVLGVGTEQLWIAGGVVLFAISDLLLAQDRFVQARPLAPLTVAISYHLAQALLLLGLVS